VVAPSPPFSDTGPVRSAAEPAFGPPQLLTVACPVAELAAVAERLAGHGVGDLHVVVRLDGLPDTGGARAVALLAEARIAVLEIGPMVTPGAARLAGWFEFGKACVSYGVPLSWSGSLPSDAVEHWAHLPPPRNQPSWQGRWRYGALGWRRGPGFAQVIDGRADVIRQRRIQLGGLAPWFGDMLDHPAPAGAVPPAILAKLRDAGLVAVFAGQAVWLPYRLRRWPSNTFSI